jgi:hypothetical protein
LRLTRTRQFLMDEVSAALARAEKRREALRECARELRTGGRDSQNQRIAHSVAARLGEKLAGPVVLLPPSSESGGGKHLEVSVPGKRWLCCG